MLLLQIENLTHYFGGLRAVSNFNLTLGENELVGLIGPNGAGKTTIFNLICGLYKPSKGELHFNGTNLRGKFPHQITRLGIGRTFQNIRLWNELTVLDNVRIAHFSQLNYSMLDVIARTRKLATTERQVTADSLHLLEMLGLREYQDAVVKNLPYGIQRRVEITRALAVKPRLVLLDEPAAGMNQSEIGDLMELIQWMRKEFRLTIYIIEHQMRVIMGICERIMVLDFGETIAEGDSTAILNHPKVIEAYLGEEVG